MIYYRLLRDNKESGPYSEEEMIAKGFKPYDLLWAEGKSAGWQYPSEIAPFKKYAPIVEEQPYDRFYKKQPAQKPIAATEQRAAVPPIVPVLPIYQYNVADLPAKHIHVTLPSGNTVNLTTLVAKKEVKEQPEPAENKKINADKINLVLPATPVLTEQRLPSFSEKAHSSLHPEKVTTPTAVAAISPATGNENNERSFIGRPQSAGNSFSWTLVLGGIVGIATLVGLGIMIGLSINRTKTEAAFEAALRTKSVSPVADKTPVQAATIPAVSISVKEDPVPQAPRSATALKNKELVQNAVVKTPLLPVNDLKEEKKTAMNAANTATDKSPDGKVLPGADETIQHTKAVPAVNNTAAIERSLRVSANDFKTGTFGGISNLKYTLFNGSKSPLESVEVEVDYLQANHKIYKTEKIVFKDISAGGQVMMDAPASPRGVKVTSRITKINARDNAIVNTTAKS